MRARYKYTMTEDANLSSSYIAVYVFNAFFCLTAIMLNSLAIQALTKTVSLPKPLKTLLLSLAVSDLGVGLLVQPLGIAVFIMEMKHDIAGSSYEITSSVFRVLANLFYYASFSGVTALTVDRFLAIHLHLRYQELVTNKRVVVLVTSIWTLSAFFSLFSFWIPETIRRHIYLTFELVCLLTTALLYSKIYLAVRRHTREIQALQVQQQAPNGEAINAARQGKSAVGTFYVYVVFLACYLPFNCWYIGTLITDMEKNLSQYFEIYTWTLAWLNSSLNPLIYCWKMKQIRQAMKNILQNILPGHN